MAQQLWFLRHGEAEPHDARPDDDRRLTARGERQSAMAGEALARLGIEFAAVLTSPKVRAVDTAKLAAAALGVDPTVYEPLDEGFDRTAALSALSDLDGDARVLLVGHEPDFSETIESLTGAQLDLKKGGLAAVRVEGEGGELAVLLRPRELETLAR